jgi:hypothetical protein
MRLGLAETHISKSEMWGTRLCCFPTHAPKAAHEWGTRAFVVRRTDGEAGSLREWKERKANAGSSYS